MKSIFISLTCLVLSSSPSIGQVIINEINLADNWVELYNPSGGTEDVSSWWLCDRQQYGIISSLNILSGSTTMTSGSYLVIEWASISASVGELGLYNSSDFGSSLAIKDYVQYGGVASPSRASVAVASGVWGNANDFVSFPALSTHTLENINFLASSGTDTDVLDWLEGFETEGLTNNDNVIINEIDPVAHWVELYNPSNASVDVSSWQLCNRPSYTTISSLVVLSGSTTISAGGYLVVEWTSIQTSTGELGLYRTAGFGTVANIRDYIQYGGIASPSRASVAVAAGLWPNSSDFVSFPAFAGHHFENINFVAQSPLQTSSSDWWDGFNSASETNHDNVIINEINPDNHWVELFNPTNTAIDVGNWYLCDRPSYGLISSQTILSGAILLHPDSFVVIEWSPIANSTGELGLYIDASFANAASLKDYVQYGGISSPSRASVAVAAGIWANTSDFVALPELTNNSMENRDSLAVSGIQTSLGDWAEDAATANENNFVASCPLSYTSANGNLLTGIEIGMANFETDGAIESEQTISATAIVIYDSGTSIDLLLNFEVELGGEFTTIIDGCN